MERFLLLLDEVDEYVGLGRIFVSGAMSDVASATQHAASHVKGWTSAAQVHARGWMATRQNDPS